MGNCLGNSEYSEIIEGNCYQQPISNYQNLIRNLRLPHFLVGGGGRVEEGGRGGAQPLHKPTPMTRTPHARRAKYIYFRRISALTKLIVIPPLPKQTLVYPFYIYPGVGAPPYWRWLGRAAGGGGGENLTLSQTARHTKNTPCHNIPY